MKKKNFEILRVTYLAGPSIWTYQPIIEAWIDLGELEDYPSNTIPGFYERLTGMLPSLVEHYCGVGERGGFLQRLRTGTWTGHIMEHVCLELQSLAGMPVTFGKARETDVRGVYKVVFRTDQEQVGRKALELGKELVLAAINDEPFDVAGAIEQLRRRIDRDYLGPSTAHIVRAAEESKIPFIRLNDVNLVQLGYGAKQRRIWTAETDGTSAIAESIASDKTLTKSLLSAAGVPVPEGQEVDNADEAWEVAQDIGLPVVVKPSDGNHGRGVFTNLRTREQVQTAFVGAEKEGSSVIVERYVEGQAYRLLVVGNRVVAASRGKTITVQGNGLSTVLELIEDQINSDPRCGFEAEFPLSPIRLHREPIVQLELERQGYSGESIPPAGQTVLLKPHGDLAYDCTDEVHPEVARLACLAARVVGLDVAGIDLVTSDITQTLESQRGAINEVNAGPGLLMHIKPMEGQPRPVGQAIVDHLFPQTARGRDCRIPVVGITGSKDTTRIARLVAWLMHINGKQVGMACKDGFFLDTRLVDAKPAISCEAGQRVLINRSVEGAVFEHTQHTILTQGLAYDRCQVGVVTDMHSDEDLKPFYINTDEHHFNVVRTQVDVVLPTGTAVLNAADAQVVEMAELCDGQVIFYALDGTLDTITSHRAQGERVVFLGGADIVLAHGQTEASRIPLSSLNPSKAEKPEMVMAAVAAAWALDIKPELIGAGLRTFNANPSKSY
jgi:cyanophycin synthetase